MNLALKQNSLKQAFNQLANPKLEQEMQNKLLIGQKINAEKQKLSALQQLGHKAIKKNSYPHINPKIDGFDFGGWMEISMANRPADWRLKRMKFFGDWCSEKSLDDILPDIEHETRERTYAITPRMFDEFGDEYDVTTYFCVNPESMDDLETQVRQYCKHVAELKDYKFDLDRCYFEVRA